MDDGYGILTARAEVVAATSTLVNEIQTLNPSSVPDAGSATLTFYNNQGEDIGETSALAFGATEAEIQAAVDVVLGAGNCAVVGTWGLWVELTFQGDFAAQDMGETLVTHNFTTVGAPVTVPNTETAKGVSGGCLVVPSTTYRRVARYVKVIIRANSGAIRVGGGCDAQHPTYGVFENAGEYEIPYEGLGNQNQLKNTGIYYDNPSGAGTDLFDIIVQYHNEKQG